MTSCARAKEQVILQRTLSEKLGKRNMAAHPSLVVITQYQAEDVISDLVNNVILKLT